MKNNVQIIVSNAKNINQLKSHDQKRHEARTFYEIYRQKKMQALTPPQAAVRHLEGPAVVAVKKVLNNMINNHEAALSSIKEAMQINDQRPEKLLSIQFKTGAFFLREQMFCKTAELFSNSLKNFTQMQV